MLVAGQAEPLVEIAARTPLALVRLAWHLGNRHTDVQIVGDRLRIRRDHVLEEMVRASAPRSRRSTRRSIRSAGAPHGHRRDHGHLTSTMHGKDHGACMNQAPPRSIA